MQITALIPIVVFPLWGILSSSQVCNAYLDNSNAKFAVGLMMAIAVEYSGLHKRIALNAIKYLGANLRR